MTGCPGRESARFTARASGEDAPAARDGRASLRHHQGQDGRNALSDEDAAAGRHREPIAISIEQGRGDRLIRQPSRLDLDPGRPATSSGTTSGCNRYPHTSITLASYGTGLGDEISIVKHTVVIGGHKTSISLEEPFWTALKEIAQAEHMTLSALIGEIDDTRENINLSSEIRIFVLRHFRSGEWQPSGPVARTPRRGERNQR